MNWLIRENLRPPQNEISPLPSKVAPNPRSLQASAMAEIIADARFWSRGIFRISGLVASKRAAAPVSAGVAIDVPLITPNPIGTVDITPTPGPVRSVSG